MDNLREIAKRITELSNIAENMTDLGYHSTQDLKKNTVEWAVCHQFYTEALEIRQKLQSLSNEISAETERREAEIADYAEECVKTKATRCENARADDDLPF